MSLPQIYLASASPRRAELLQQLGIHYEVVAQEVEEQSLANEAPQAFVQRLALTKAWAGWRQLTEKNRRPVLGADTAVVVDDPESGTHILGKPVDRAHALAMLAQLSGRSHRVLSAVAVVGEDNLGQDKAVVRKEMRELVRCSESKVWFTELSQADSEAYWATGEPADKAGGYGIQGLAALFISRLEGSYSGVMGLPLFETGELLRQFGIKMLRNEDDNKQ